MENPLLNNERPSSGTCEYLKERIWVIIYTFLFICFASGAIILGVGNNVEVCDFDSDYNCWDQSCRREYYSKSYPCTCTDNRGLVFCGVKGPIMGLIIAGAVLMGVACLSFLGIYLYNKYK